MAKKKVVDAPVVNINANTDQYVTAKTASGNRSLNSGDIVARTFSGMTIDEVFAVASKFLKTGEDLGARYGHLNDGMKRMNIGNRTRTQIRAIDANNATKLVDGKKAGASGEDSFLKASIMERKAADKRAKDAEKEAKANSTVAA